MLLTHLKHADAVREFDPSTGAVGSAADVSRDQAQWGFVWRQRGRWFAIRKDDESLIFQAGPRWWRLSNDVELRVTRGFVRRFELERDGRTAFSLRYFFRGAAQAAIDPTYDTLDEEADDFFLYVTAMWRHWKDKRMDTFLAD